MLLRTSGPGRSGSKSHGRQALQFSPALNKQMGASKILGVLSWGPGLYGGSQYFKSTFGGRDFGKLPTGALFEAPLPYMGIEGHVAAVAKAHLQKQAWELCNADNRSL